MGKGLGVMCPARCPTALEQGFGVEGLGMGWQHHYHRAQEPSRRKRLRNSGNGRQNQQPQR
ncbi:MAG: hypothetical protein AAF215_05285 [Cyanobacteria bacterium P01_A01_bin.123]